MLDVGHAQPSVVSLDVVTRLLAFVLALSLALASTIFLERRAGSLAESNAIGTAWLRAQAIPGPAAHEIARRLEEYTRVRIAYVEGEGNPGMQAELVEGGCPPQPIAT